MLCLITAKTLPRELHLSVYRVPTEDNEYSKAYIEEQLMPKEADNPLIQECIKEAINKFCGGRWRTDGFHLNQERGTVFIDLKLAEEAP